MSFKPALSESIRLFVLVSFISLLLSLSVSAQMPDLEIKVGDTTGSPGELNSVISVFMKNYADTVAGFELWLMLNRNDIMEFQTDEVIIYDTSYWRCHQYSGPNCVDSTDITDSVLITPSYPYDFLRIHSYPATIGSHDTTGTLIAGWESVTSRSLSGFGYDLKVVAQANTLRPPYTHGIGYPQLGAKPLVKILADVYSIPDTLEDRTCTIYIQASSLDNFSFSDQAGNSIGVITDTTIDTTWWVCESWVVPDSICLVWTQVGQGPVDSVDSFWCCDTILSGHLDTTKVKLYNGSLLVLQGICGDINNNGIINLLDITYLINYVYKGGPPPPSPGLCDINHCSGSINILDITYLINYIYKAGPAPDCCGK
jgi:hypothetical protein